METFLDPHIIALRNMVVKEQLDRYIGDEEISGARNFSL